MITRKGIYYFRSYEAARAYARANGFTTDRFLCYGAGWAIQLYASGPYVGPETPSPKLEEIR